MTKLLKIGHRGAKAYVAENTLESISKALEFNVDAIELDVHKCKTGEVVVLHDFTIDRTTDGTGEVARKSWKKLQSLTIEGKYKIPLLTEVLDHIEGKCSINIELKGSNTADVTCEIIQKYISEKGWKYSDFIISSFQTNELFLVRKLDENIPIGVLSKASMTQAIELGKQLNASAIHPSLGIISRKNVVAAHEAGFKVNVWTVNEPGEIERMISYGVDGIISDYPDRL